MVILVFVNLVPKFVVDKQNAQPNFMWTFKSWSDVDVAKYTCGSKVCVDLSPLCPVNTANPVILIKLAGECRVLRQWRIEKLGKMVILCMYTI